MQYQKILITLNNTLKFSISVSGLFEFVLLPKCSQFDGYPLGVCYFVSDYKRIR